MCGIDSIDMFGVTGAIFIILKSGRLTDSIFSGTQLNPFPGSLAVCPQSSEPLFFGSGPFSRRFLQFPLQVKIKMAFFPSALSESLPMRGVFSFAAATLFNRGLGCIGVVGFGARASM